MKHSQLKSIAHNMADSFASGIGLMIGLYEIHIFKEAMKNKNRSITVDFLNGFMEEGIVSASFEEAVRRYSQILPEFCEKHGCSVTSFQRFTAKYFFDASFSQRVSIAVKDENNRYSINEYVSQPLKRLKILDHLGRIRKKPTLKIVTP